MEIINVRHTYRMLGNFINLLLNNEQRIKNMLLDYEIQTKVDKLPNGQEIKSLFFTNKNVIIKFTPINIEYEYNFIQPRLSDEEIYLKAKQFFVLLGEIFPDVLGARVAFVRHSFIENDDGRVISDLTDKMGLTTQFGNCDELAFRINTPVESFESLNCVYDVNMGQAKNNKTNDVKKVLLLTIDVNTFIEKKDPRFNPYDFDNFFKPLLEISIVKEEQMKKYI